MPRVSKGCLTAFCGVLAAFFDALFVAALIAFPSQGDRISCRAAGCHTMIVPMILSGLFGALLTLVFLGLIFKPKAA